MLHILTSALVTSCILFCFDSLRPSQQFFSYVWTGLQGLNQYETEDKVSLSRTQHSASGEA